MMISLEDDAIEQTRTGPWARGTLTTRSAIATLACLVLALVSIACGARPAGPPPGLWTGELVVEGLDEHGKPSSWRPEREKLSILVVLRATDCAGCANWFPAGVVRLLDQRAEDIDACYLFMGGGGGGYAPGARDRRIHKLFTNVQTAPLGWDLPALPYAFVWTREGYLARAEWLPSVGKSADAVAADLDQYFGLGPDHPRPR
jgi:hypothetical protein